MQVRVERLDNEGESMWEERSPTKHKYDLAQGYVEV